MLKTFTTFFLALCLSLPAVGLFSSSPAYAKDYCPNDNTRDVKVDLGVGIGDKKSFQAECGQGLLVQYVKTIFNWGTGLISALAVLVIIIGGYRYMTSGGSPDKVEGAKNMIVGALSGLLLVIFAYVILNAINPEILQ